MTLEEEVQLRNAQQSWEASRKLLEEERLHCKWMQRWLTDCLKELGVVQKELTSWEKRALAAEAKLRAREEMP